MHGCVGVCNGCCSCASGMFAILYFAVLCCQMLQYDVILVIPRSSRLSCYLTFHQVTTCYTMEFLYSVVFCFTVIPVYTVLFPWAEA